MSSVRRLVLSRNFRSLLLLAAITCFPQIAAADTKAPASVAALIPAGLQIKEQSWNFEDYEEDDDEVGATGVVHYQRFSWDVKALFPGAVTCDFTIGPQFNISLLSDSLWEDDRMDVWEMTTASDRDFDAQVKSRFEFIKVHVKDLYGALAIAEPQSEQLPNGHVNYVEFNWKCAKNPGGENIWMDGYAHRGATVLEFSFWANAGRTEALAMATEILAKFEKLDIAELRQLGSDHEQ